MPLPLQTRLLRVLEEKEVTRVGGHQPIPVDVRVISATHCNLEQEMKQGEFRTDLFLSPEHFTPQAAAATRALARYPAAGRRFFKTVAGGTGCAVF